MPKKHCRSLDDWLGRACEDGEKTVARIENPPDRESGTAKELKDDILYRVANVLLAKIADIRVNGPDSKKIFEAGRLYGHLEVMTDNCLLREVATAIDLSRRRKEKGRGKRDVQETDKLIIAGTTAKLRPGALDSQIAQRLRDEWKSFGLSRQFGIRTLLNHIPK
jgi:hypothetical protein